MKEDIITKILDRNNLNEAFKNVKANKGPMIILTRKFINTKYFLLVNVDLIFCIIDAVTIPAAIPIISMFFNISKYNISITTILYEGLKKAHVLLS